MQIEKILIVEDEPVVALDLQQSLLELGHEVVDISTNFDEAIAAVSALMPSLVLMDIHIAGHLDGIDACNEIYRRWKLPVIFLTAYADDKTVDRATLCKPFGYVLKPFESKELSAVIQVARVRHDTEALLAKSQQRLALALDAAELGCWEWESRLNEFSGDERFHRIWGMALRPFQTDLQAMLACIHPDDRSIVEAHFSDSGLFSTEFRARRSSGQYAWLEIYGKLLLEPAAPRLVIGAIRDITARKTMEESLRRASVVFDTAVEGMMILDVQARIITANPAFFKMTGYAAADIEGRSPTDFLIVRRDSDPAYADIAGGESGYWSGEAPCLCRDGRILPTLQHICVVRNESGHDAQFVHSISDISSIREAERQLVHLAYHDPLTGLGNRYLLDQRLALELERARQSGSWLAVLFIDLDGFKAINDTMGHHVGDRLIQEAAKRIVGQIRRNDEAIRLGGDEFVVLITDLGQAAEADMVAEKILKTLLEPQQIEELQFKIGASIGVAKFPGDGNTLGELLSAADSAMYEAKRRGKGRICYYSNDLTENVRTRLNIEQSLHRALEYEEFELYYQPVIETSTARLIGFEALLRWHHPVAGLIGPDQFIQIAEESGLIEAIGAWVLDQALAQLQRWNTHLVQPLFMAVNVSPRQFQNEGLQALIEAALLRHSVPAACLEIEITESTLQDFHRSRKIVDAMRKLGVSVAIDDFGTGYSSIALLRHLAISRIKIDRSFVSALPGSSRDVGLVGTIMGMAKSLDLLVTAEGIEIREQAAVLREMGCPAMQGYLFGHPLPASAYTPDWFSGAGRAGSFDALACLSQSV
ncbi:MULTISPECIES: EAL domain-containing protein [unclassified Undibacterium]|nr:MULTISPECIES: EAL domain-containing protein [unclassified Undibacterium]MEB0215757.1 EAL domain-containing protein [Undibacterium sp. 5I2]WPX45178.1 EAL domain-containing protein [Undibacterium sp. CCC3.4]